MLSKPRLTSVCERVESAVETNQPHDFAECGTTSETKIYLGSPYLFARRPITSRKPRRNIQRGLFYETPGGFRRPRHSPLLFEVGAFDGRKCHPFIGMLGSWVVSRDGSTPQPCCQLLVSPTHRSKRISVSSLRVASTPFVSGLSK